MTCPLPTKKQLNEAKGRYMLYLQLKQEMKHEKRRSNSRAGIIDVDMTTKNQIYIKIGGGVGDSDILPYYIIL